MALTNNVLIQDFQDKSYEPRKCNVVQNKADRKNKVNIYR